VQAVEGLDGRKRLPAAANESSHIREICPPAFAKNGGTGISLHCICECIFITISLINKQPKHHVSQTHALIVIICRQIYAQYLRLQINEHFFLKYKSKEKRRRSKIIAVNQIAVSPLATIPCITKVSKKKSRS
jgi:hypothetical protein